MKFWDEELEGYREEARALLEHLPELQGFESEPDLAARARLMRKSFDETMPIVPSENAEVSSIPGPAGEIPVRLFRPKGPARGLFLHIHGGGWILGRPEMNDVTNADFAERFGLAVLSVDYRLAPEHPYPAAPDDCEAAARWLLEEGPKEFGADRLFIGGESAGGHLTLVTALRVRDRLDAGDRLAGLNLVFGWYDVNGTPSQRDNGGHKDMLSPDGLRIMAEAFTPGRSEEERRVPDISPLFADLAGLPPSLVTVGSFDHLRDDSLFLASRLAAAGVDTDLQVYPDSPHGFQSLPTQMAAAHARRTDVWIQRVMKESGI